MKYKVILYLFSLLIFFSCDDFLKENPEDFLSPENMPQTEDDCELMLNGVVGRLVETSSNGEASYLYDWQLLKLAELSADELIETGKSGADYQLDSYTYFSDNKHIYGTWAQLYRLINDANTMITKIPAADLDDAVIEKYVAAAKFLRALAYFHLVNLYGNNVILIEEPVSDFSEVLSVSSSSVAETYKLIASDVEYATGKNTKGENRLPVDEWDEAGRPTYGAAKALQASVYMSMAGYPLEQSEYWEKARDAASVVMGISNYSLYDDIATLFSMENDNGPEFIFSAQYYLPNYGSMMAAQTRPDAWKSVKASEEFLKTFSVNDLRRSNYLITEWNGKPYTQLSGKVPYVGKWKDIGRDVLSEYNKRTALNNPIFRISEMYLIYAEAENEVNGPTLEAYDALNAIRTRAGLDAVSGLSKDNFRDSLKLERHHELCFEYKRRYDLLRWNDLEEAMKNDPEVSSEFNIEEHRYYPVPEHDVLLNEGLE